MLTWGGRVASALAPSEAGATRTRTAGTRARATRRALAGAGLALLLALGAAVPAPAAGRADPGAECPPGQSDCSVWDDDPGTPGGGGDTGGGGDPGGGGGGGGKCQWNGRTVKCYDDVLGWFNNGDGCYYKLSEPQQEAPEGKQWYTRTCNGGDLGTETDVLLDAPPPGFGAPPDPEELARRALAKITIAAPRIAVAPRRSNGPGLVGLPVWMWGSNDDPKYFGPTREASETDRGLTVKITATFDRIVWDMGNGGEVTCYGAGTPYRADGQHAGQDSPDCGYDSGYPKAGDYRVRATTHWTVTWYGDGESGVISLTRTTGTVPVRINELQVVSE
ncbi:hypothetical protein ACGF5C_29750 [Micromonospora sp. NPDC047620]|uniref:hypothetical protein n=1 Tax=Micromonospora sp. NPDC047620 TaxID=3364251 RepID=UPI00371756CD